MGARTLLDSLLSARAVHILNNRSKYGRNSAECELLNLLSTLWFCSVKYLQFSGLKDA
jgi:hypothetical protein